MDIKPSLYYQIQQFCKDFFQGCDCRKGCRDSELILFFAIQTFFSDALVQKLIRNLQHHGREKNSAGNLQLKNLTENIIQFYRLDDANLVFLW